jgi:hypothetical protein
MPPLSGPLRYRYAAEVLQSEQGLQALQLDALIFALNTD